MIAPTQTVPANSAILSAVSTEHGELSLKLSGQNPICASAVCIPSLLVPTLQWSRRSRCTGSSRNHNGHHPDSSHSHAGDEQQGAHPTQAIATPLSRESFLYCRWQNTYFVPPSLLRWNKALLKTHREGYFRTVCCCNKVSLSQKILVSSLHYRYLLDVFLLMLSLVDTEHRDEPVKMSVRYTWPCTAAAHLSHICWLILFFFIICLVDQIYSFIHCHHNNRLVCDDGR